MDVIEVLESARDMLIFEHTWVKGDLAVDSDGKSCLPYDDDACCWCLSGAISNAAAGFDEVGEKVSDILSEELYPSYRSIEDFNDNLETSHSDIMELLDTTIEKYQKGEIE